MFEFYLKLYKLSFIPIAKGNMALKILKILIIIPSNYGLIDNNCLLPVLSNGPIEIENWSIDNYTSTCLQIGDLCNGDN